MNNTVQAVELTSGDVVSIEGNYMEIESITMLGTDRLVLWFKGNYNMTANYEKWFVKIDSK